MSGSFKSRAFGLQLEPLLMEVLGAMSGDGPSMNGTFGYSKD